jgi:hypothetical protein
MPSQAAAINVVSIVATCEVSEVWHFPEWLIAAVSAIP